MKKKSKRKWTLLNFFCVQCSNQRGRKKRVVVNIGFCFYLTIEPLLFPTAGPLSVHHSLLLLRNSIYRSINWLAVADWLNYDKRFKFSRNFVFNSFSPVTFCWMENRNLNKCNHRSTSISILVLDWNSRHILAMS